MVDRKTDTLKNTQSVDVQGLDKAVELSIFAPDAQSVSLAGSFNEWQDAVALKKGKGGRWSGRLKLKPGRYEYRFLVDGRWESDPSAPNVPNPFGSTNCILEVGA